MSGFPTSRLSQFPGVNDPFREQNISRADVGSFQRENAEYGSTAENSPALPPFMAANIAKNRGRRNFYVKDGGDIVFFNPEEEETVVVTKRVFNTSR